MNNPIFDYVKQVFRYGLILTPAGKVLLCNNVLLEALGGVTPSSLEDVFGITGQAVVSSLLNNAVQQSKMQRAELLVDFGDGLIPVFTEVSTLAAEGEQVVIILFHPVQTLLSLESALFDRKSKSLSDSRWVIDEAGIILHFKADEESIFSGRPPGSSIFEAIKDNDRAVVREALNKSKSSGEMVTITVEVLKTHGDVLIEADIRYAPDVFYGNRFFILSRPVTNKTVDILSRLKEAYQANNDIELSEYLGVKPPYLSRIRKGNKKVPADWILQCHFKHGIEPVWIVYGKGKKLVETKFEQGYEGTAN